MLLALEDGADIATGQRIYKPQLRLFSRLLASQGYVRLMRWALAVHLKDPETGYKFFKRERVLALLDQVQSEGWFWDTEIMVRSLLAGLTIRELPCLFVRRYDKASSVKLVPDSLDYARKPLAIPRGRARASRRRRPFRGARGYASATAARLKHVVDYSHRTVYGALMRLLYGRDLSTDRPPPKRNPAGCNVIEVCSGDGRLYRDYLRHQPIRYKALDLSPQFVGWITEHGSTLASSMCAARRYRRRMSSSYYPASIGSARRRVRRRADGRGGAHARHHHGTRPRPFGIENPMFRFVARRLTETRSVAFGQDVRRFD